MRLGYKVDCFVDMESCAILAIEIMAATISDTTSLKNSFEKVKENFKYVDDGNNNEAGYDSFIGAVTGGKLS